MLQKENKLTNCRLHINHTEIIATSGKSKEVYKENTCKMRAIKIIQMQDIPLQEIPHWLR